MSVGARIRQVRTRIRWAFARTVLVTSARLLLRIRVIERPDLPPGPYVLASNHLCWIDPFVYMSVLPLEPRIWFLGNQDAVFNARWKQRLIMPFGGVIPLDLKARFDSSAMSQALAVLERGEVLGIFPEGGIGLGEGQPLPFKAGVGFLAYHGRCPVVPAALAGTHEIWRGKEVVVRLGAPIQPSSVEPSSAAIRATTEAVEQAVRALMPAYQEPVDVKKPWPWLTRLLS